MKIPRLPVLPKSNKPLTNGLLIIGTPKSDKECVIKRRS